MYINNQAKFDETTCFANKNSLTLIIFDKNGGDYREILCFNGKL